MVVFKVFLVLIAALTFSPLTHAGDGDRTKQPFGLYLTGNGDPTPSAASLGLGLNLTSFFRLHANLGGYNNALANAPRGVYNYTLAPIEAGAVAVVKPLFFGLAWFFDGLINFVTSGHNEKHLKYEDFWAGGSYKRLKSPYLDSQAVLSYGGGSQLFVPGWKLSPTAGIDWAHYDSSGSAYGLKGTGSHTYYKGGLDWQGVDGGNAAAGLNFCPNFTKKACGFYMSIGKFF